MGDRKNCTQLICLSLQLYGQPDSNFILVEKYADDRKTETWDKAVESALKHLPVKIVQVVSDQGRSLICHALKSLKVHHSPDCFHVI